MTHRDTKDAIAAQIAASIAQLSQYTQRHPDNAEAWLKLALALQAMDIHRHEGGTLQPRAMQAFERALELLDPEDEDDNDLRKLCLLRKGVLHTTMAEPRQSIALFDEAIATYGGDGELYHNLGLAHAMVGGEHLQLAATALRNAVREGHTDSYEPLVSVHAERNDLNDDQWSAMVEQMQACDGAEASVCVQFALSKAMHQLRRYDEAYRHMRQANDLQLAHNLPVGHKEHVRQMASQVAMIFTPEFLEAYQNRRTSSKLPIFIIGMMRSGSTLLEQILDAQGDIYGLGEDSIVNGRLAQFRDNLVQVASNGDEAVAAFIDESAQRFVQEMLAKVPEARRARTKHVVDKMLFNYRNVGFIHILYPQAVIIHMVRDPVDCLFSCYRQKFDDHGLTWASSFECMVDEYMAYLQLMAHWRKVLPGRVIDVLYDDLVNDTERVVREIVAELDVEFSPRMLDFHQSQRPVQTNSMAQVRHPINTSGLGSWRKYESHLRPLMELLQPVLREAKRQGMLPFPDKLDWEMSYFSSATQEQKSH